MSISCRPLILSLLVALLAVFSAVRAEDSYDGPPLAEAKAQDPNASKVTGRAVTLSDFGAEDLGYLALPNTQPTVGIVLIPDAFGLDDFTKLEVDRLASEGYIALAVDVYNGSHSTDPGQIANMVANLDGPTVMKTVDAGLRVFRESPKYHVDHIIVMGWGVGANYAWQAANDKMQGPDGAILFYGPIENGRIDKCPVPVCALYSDRDPSVTKDQVLNFQHALRGAGSDFSAWFIAAGTGWSNPLNKSYSPVEDREAWKVADPFIQRIAAMPVVKRGPSTMDKVKDSMKDLLKKL